MKKIEKKRNYFLEECRNPANKFCLLVYSLVNLINYHLFKC